MELNTTQRAVERLAAVQARLETARAELARVEADAYPKRLDGTAAARGAGEGPSGIHEGLQIDSLRHEITLLEREQIDLEQLTGRTA